MLSRVMPLALTATASSRSVGLSGSAHFQAADRSCRDRAEVSQRANASFVCMLARTWVLAAYAPAVSSSPDGRVHMADDTPDATRSELYRARCLQPGHDRVGSPLHHLPRLVGPRACDFGDGVGGQELAKGLEVFRASRRPGSLGGPTATNAGSPPANTR